MSLWPGQIRNTVRTPKYPYKLNPRSPLIRGLVWFWPMTEPFTKDFGDVLDLSPVPLVITDVKANIDVVFGDRGRFGPGWQVTNSGGSEQFVQFSAGVPLLGTAPITQFSIHHWSGAIDGLASMAGIIAALAGTLSIVGKNNVDTDWGGYRNGAFDTDAPMPTTDGEWWSGTLTYDQSGSGVAKGWVDGVKGATEPSVGSGFFAPQQFMGGNITRTWSECGRIMMWDRILDEYEVRLLEEHPWSMIEEIDATPYWFLKAGVGGATTGVGASAGVASVTAVGRSINATAGTAAGVGAATAVFSNTTGGVGASAGVATPAAVGHSIHRAVGSSTGQAIVTAASTSVAADSWVPERQANMMITPGGLMNR